jgi:hypothetical protein
MTWTDEQGFEAGWWGDCSNTLGEQFKHPTYARLMGMPFINDGGKYFIDKPGLSILDIGGGPASMLLCTRAARRTVVDPCPYPDWTRLRYAAAGIELVQAPAEDFAGGEYDEAWCYNVLQHVRDPKEVIDVMRRSARVIRILEWVNLPPHPGHPHELKSEKLAEWAGISNWSETWVGWDHWVGGEYNDYLAFHGYTETGSHG